MAATIKAEGERGFPHGQARAADRATIIAVHTFQFTRASCCLAHRVAWAPVLVCFLFWMDACQVVWLACWCMILVCARTCQVQVKIYSSQ